MNESKMDITISDKSTNDKVTLPVEREKLGTFIYSLLGQPQSIEREIYGTFSIDHAWFLHIHALIDQRIRQQNHATLTDFKVYLYFEDNLKRTINSIEAFEHFSETKKLKSQGIKISWTYLISFPGKQIPEKQEISLYASTKAPSASKPQDPIRRIISSKHKLGVISYSINHTERTWGDDIETLLKHELDLVLEEEGLLKLVGNLALLVFSLILIISGLLFPELMNILIQEKLIADIFHNYPKIISLKIENINDIGTKLDLLLKAINPSNEINKVNFGYRLMMMFGSMFMSIWCLLLTERKKLSFVVLSRESQADRDRAISKSKRNFILVVISFVFSILAGVIGNYLYYALMT